MDLIKRYDKPLSGVVAGIIFPLIAFTVFYLTTAKGFTPGEYFRRISLLGNLPQILSVSVFSNIIIFLIFNRFDMLRAAKGVLGVTIIWAFIVFGIKLL
ncbi:MAG: hypothetical protein E4G92_06270 [Bacteroidia bacterium]|nr:MAG: hypothetical protein E4G92_06270 [Bacteroidia bacterium]